MDGDTDLLLVLLETSLPPPVVFSREELLEALIACDGDVQRAASSLTNNYKSVAHLVHKPSSKRKAETGLDSWIRNSKRPRPSDNDGSSDGNDAKSLSGGVDGLNSVAGPSTSRDPPRSTSPNGSAARSTPPPLLSFLRDNSPKSITKPRLPVLLLATSKAISEHTPTTLHTSILPAGQPIIMLPYT